MMSDTKIPVGYTCSGREGPKDRELRVPNKVNLSIVNSGEVLDRLKKGVFEDSLLFDLRTQVEYLSLVRGFDYLYSIAARRLIEGYIKFMYDGAAPFHNNIVRILPFLQDEPYSGHNDSLICLYSIFRSSQKWSFC